MKRIICFLLLLSLLVQPLAADTIITRRNRRIEGKILKRVKNNLVVRTYDGNTTLVPFSSIAQVFRGNQVLDLVKNQKYYLEKRRPFLPFMVLGAVSAAYSIDRFQEYNRIHNNAQSELAGANPGTQTTHDSTTPMAVGIVSGLFSVGCFYIALRPMVVKVPMGKIKVGATPQTVTLALEF